MSETTNQTPANTSNPNEGAADTGAVAATETHTEGQAEPAPTGQPERPARKPWYENRISVLTAQKGTYQQQNSELTRQLALRDAELERYRSQNQGTGQNNDPEHRPASTDTRTADQQIDARVAERTAAMEFNAGCDRLARTGQAAYPDFQQAADGWNQAGMDWGNADHRELISDINSLPNAADVFYRLGKDRDEVSHLLSLSPRAQARALERFASGVGATSSGSTAPAAAEPAPRPIPVSAAPPPSAKPVTTGSTSGRVDFMDPNAPMDDRWMSEWRKQNGYAK